MMRIDYNDVVFKECDLTCLEEILSIQDEVINELAQKDILRKNSESMLKSCLMPPNITLGAWYNGALIAFSVLYFPTDAEENLAVCLDNVNINGVVTANNKLCIVKSCYRGNSLQCELSNRLEVYAKGSGVTLMCATVSPKNRYSMNNILKLGYKYNKTFVKYGFERNLYYKFI